MVHSQQKRTTSVRKGGNNASTLCHSANKAQAIKQTCVGTDRGLLNSGTELQCLETANKVPTRSPAYVETPLTTSQS